MLLHLETCFKVSTTALGLSSQIHPMTRHILSTITSYRKVRPIFTHVFFVRFSDCRIIVSSCFIFSVLKRNRRFIAFVSCSLILSRVFWVRDQFSLPKNYTVDVFHHPVVLHSPRYVFASVDLHISPPSRIYGSHSFFNTSCTFP